MEKKHNFQRKESKQTDSDKGVEQNMSAFDKIIGYDSIKAELKMLCDCWKYPEKYAQWGCKPPHGLLLIGEPGIGKTLFATCCIEECGLPYFICRKEKARSAFLEEMKAMFDKAKAAAPSILLFDDMDKYSNDSEDDRRDAEEYVAVQSLVDAAKECGVHIIATVNRQHVLPESLIRSGRFDVHIRMTFPSVEDTEKIIRHYLSEKKYNVDHMSLKDFAGILHENACADMESVINEAALYAGYENKSTLSEEDLIRACLRKFFGAPESCTEISPEIRLRIAYHEAGHAVISTVLEPDSVNLISIKSCGVEIGGITSYRKNRDYRFRMCYQENHVLRNLGGKAASELVFGEVDTGSGSDLQSIAWDLEQFRDNYIAYGFVKQVTCDSPESIKADGVRTLAEHLEEYYKKAKQILVEHRPFLDALAKELMEKETLLGYDIERIRKNSDR